MINKENHMFAENVAMQMCFTIFIAFSLLFETSQEYRNTKGTVGVI